MSRLIPKYQNANKGKIGYHLERDINGNYVWVPNNKVGAEHAIAYSHPALGTIQRTAPTKRLSQNALRHGDLRQAQQRAEELEKKALKGDLQAVAELGAMKGPDEVKAIDPFSDETTLASERALYYWDPIRGLSLRWNTSWDNDTNPVKAVINSPIMYANPITGAVASTYHLASDNGIRKTYNLAKEGKYGQAALSGVGDILDVTMLGYFPKGLNGMARGLNGELQATASPLFDFNESSQSLLKGGNSFSLKGSPLSIALENITSPEGFKIVKDVTKNNPFSFSNYKFLGDNRFTSDLRLNPHTLMDYRIEGNYPLTFGERRQWITGVKDDIRKGINFVKEESETNPSITGLSSRDDVEYVKLLDKKLDDGNIPLDEWNQAYDEYTAMIPEWKHQSNLRRLLDAENTAKFGTRTSINHYGKGRDVYPIQANYGAFALSGNTYYPFRTRSGTLHTNSILGQSGDRILTGGHEYEHTVQAMHETPLTVYDPQSPGEYGRYTNPDLDFDLYYPAQDVVNTAGTAGQWEGSLSEMDSELKGWRAQHDLPKYSELNPEWQQYIIDLANRTFGVPSDYTLGAARKASEAQGYPVDDYIKSTLQNQRFHKLFTQLELQGYKNGGKLIKRK